MTEKLDSNQIAKELLSRQDDIKRTAKRFTVLVLSSLAVWYVAVLAFFALVRHSPEPFKDANNVFTNSFQFMAVGWAIAFMYPYFLRMELKTDVSLRLGLKSVDTLDDMKDETKPIAADLKATLAEARPVLAQVSEMVTAFKKNDFGKIHKVLERLEGEMNGGGKVERLVNAIERLARKADAKAGDALEDLLEEAWTEDPAKGPSDVDKPPNAA